MSRESIADAAVGKIDLADTDGWAIAIAGPDGAATVQPAVLDVEDGAPQPEPAIVLVLPFQMVTEVREQGEAEAQRYEFQIVLSVAHAEQLARAFARGATGAHLIGRMLQSGLFRPGG